MNEEKMQRVLFKKEENLKVKLYRPQMRLFLMTSRFNTATREENKRFRERKNWNHGCLYCTPEPISEKIPFYSKIVVLEMDNDQNKIFGVGFLVNKPLVNRYNIYANQNYNRYNYIGKYRITRDELTAEEEEVFAALDVLCFKGNTHMKRGQGLRAFPIKMLLRCRDLIDIPEFIEKMFISRYSSANLESA
jgi:hypothetical protein